MEGVWRVTGVDSGCWMLGAGCWMLKLISTLFLSKFLGEALCLCALVAEKRHEA
jgi:hypothetical protein